MKNTHTLIALAAAGSLIFPLGAESEVYRVPDAPPRSVGDIESMATQAHDAVVGGAVCGGWGDSEVGTNAGDGLMSYVTGAPGRRGFPLGNLQSGLARRNDDTDKNPVLRDEETDEAGFTFPNNTLGLSTACAPNTTSVERMIWQPLDGTTPGAYVPNTLNHPNFDDPPCNDAVDESGKKVADEHSPETCANFCRYLNDFTYDDCRVFVRDRWTDENGYSYESADGYRCACRSKKYLCSEEWTTNVVNEEDCNMDVIYPPAPPEPDPPVYYDMLTNKWQPWLDPITQQPIPWLNPITGEPVPWNPQQIPWIDPVTGEYGDLSNPTPVPRPLPATIPTLTTPSVDSLGPIRSLFDERALPATSPGISLFNPHPLSSTMAKAPEKPQTTSIIAQLFRDGPIESPPELGTLILPPSIAGNPDLLYTEAVQDGAPGLVPSCIECQGRDCRCPQGNCPWLPEIVEQNFPVPVASREPKVYPSFYRGYHVETMRSSPIDDALVKTGTSDMNDPPNTACFGYYQPESDPRVLAYTKKDFRCVMDTGHSKSELISTQEFKGKTELDPSLKVESPAETRFNPNGSPWEPVLSGVSFVRLQSSSGAGGDADQIGAAFLAIDDARQKAVTQASPEQPYARGNDMTATDSTVENRTFGTRRVVDWVQRLMQDMAELQTDRRVRLRIPVSWMSHLPDIDDLLEKTGDLPQGDQTTSAGDIASTGSIDRQLKAGEDVPGKMLEALEKLYTVKEEIVPVVIPSISPQEIEAKRLAWVNDKKTRELLGQEPVPGADQIIAKLDDYGKQIDRYYAVQSQLTTTVSTLMGVEDDGSTAIARWMDENIRRYKEFTAEEQKRRNLQPLIQQVLEEALRLEDTNMQFCREDMLTHSPLYLNNYNWHPTIEGNTLARFMGLDTGTEDPSQPRPVTMEAAHFCNGTFGTFPVLCLPTERDFVFDLTSLATQHAPMRVPVLHPIELHLDIPLPPGDEDPMPAAEDLELPDLPPVPQMDAQLMNILQPLQVTNEPKPIELPPALNLDDVTNTLMEALALFKERTDAYDRYWKSVEPGDTPLTCAGDAWGELPCMHDERSMIEDWEYFTAAPTQLAPEHLQIQGTHLFNANPGGDRDPQQYPIADPQDMQESPPLRKQTVMPADGWQLDRSGGNDAAGDEVLDQIRADMRRKTINDEGKLDPKLPYGSAKDLAPFFSLPRDIDLLKKPSPDTHVAP